MIAFLAALWPSSLVDRLIAILTASLVALLIVGAIFFHVENTQKRLIQAAQDAAKAQVINEVQEKSSELERQQARLQAGALTELQNQSNAADTAAEDDQAKIQAIVEPPAPTQPTKKEDANVAPQDPVLTKAIDAINSESDAVDGLLESASGAASRKR